ncbi:phosphoglycerate dehydrogenase [Sporolactobacillus laevolacticus]|uniref:phosphoglycerate dehydrogenase n=1 Tax=Sporolactobacillus laevolacticus TaxID=33018 RepID=UPI0025B42B6D|nr:phosphoglycerate dehydrogenase [Sporolactobacillus laevolacticus]MDN3954821.1 phosphoglycerate dehydrogenase [Sporolactobacillus laevolacticus]
MKILFSVGNAFVPIHQEMVMKMEQLGAKVECLTFDASMNPDKVKEKIRDADIYVLAVTKVNREVLDCAHSLKLIIKLGTGVDNIDVNYAVEKGIVVSNAPGENAWSVAELVIGYMIALSRKLSLLDSRTKKGAWKHSLGLELSGKTLGILGFGNIGKKIAQITHVFRMNKIAFSNHKDEKMAERLGVSFVTMDQLFSESDYLVISTSLNQTNYHLIDASVFKKMKANAFLINISRGAIIDEVALFDALQTNQIGGAALDVREIEPPDSVPNLNNLMVTPHIGGSTIESIQRIANLTLENIRRFSQGESILHVVNR